MPIADNPGEPQDHLATMLAEMDNRLEMLQQELDSLAVPVPAPQPQQPPQQQQRPSIGAAADPLDSRGRPASRLAPDDPAAARADRPEIARKRLALAPRTPTPQSPVPRSTNRPPAEPHGPARDAAAKLPAGLRKRPARQIAAVPGPPAEQAAATDPARRAPAPAEQAAATDPPRRPTAPAAQPNRPTDPPRRAPAPAAQPIRPNPVVDRTILEADQEARRVVEDARLRIAAIGARTRALLEHSVLPAQAAVRAVPPPSSRPPSDAASEAPERREYQGAVTIEAWPFRDIAQLYDFERALASLAGVEDVYVRTFERNHAHFELRVVEPKPLIAELRARVPDPLEVIEAGDRGMRLRIVEDEIR